MRVLPLRLKEIELRGFRSFTKLKKVDLDFDVIVLTGGVGSGKSSLLQAIEYALFGTTFEVKERKSIKLDDLINDFEEEAEVKLKLIDDKGNIYEIIRSKQRKRRGRLRIIVNGKEYRGKECEMYLSRILGGIEYEDFSRHILIRQEVLEALIYGPPMRRSEALDKLFGISALEEAFRGIPIGEVEAKIEELEERKREFERTLEKYGTPDELEQKIKELREREKKIKEKRERAEEELKVYEEKYRKVKEIEEKQRSLMHEMARLEAIVDGLRREIRELEAVRTISMNEILLMARGLKDQIVELLIEFLREADAKRIKEIDVTKDKLRDFVREARRAIEILEDVKNEYEYELSTLNERVLGTQEVMNRLRSKLNALLMEVDELRKLREEYDALITKYGTSREVMKKIDEMKNKLNEAREKGGRERALLDVIKSVIKELTLKGKVECPICERPIEREKYEKKLIGKMDLLSRRTIEYENIVPQLKDKIEELTKVLEKLRMLEEKIVDLKLKERELRLLQEEEKKEEEKYYSLLEAIEDARRRVAQLSKALKTIRSNLETIEKYIAFMEKERELKEYESKIRKLRDIIASMEYTPEKVHTIIQRTSELRVMMSQYERELQEVRESIEEYERVINEVKEASANMEDLEKKIKALMELRDRLVTIKNLFRSIQREVRDKILERLVPIANEVFRNIYPYKDYDEIDIRVEVRKTGEGYERSIYEIYARRSIDNKWVPVLSRMSDGQKVLVSLALIIAFSKLRPRGLSLLIMDEPVPNIDSECRKAIIRTLGTTTGIRQLIIATQNPEYEEIVRVGVRKMGIKGRIYKLSYEGRKGTTIKVVH